MRGKSSLIGFLLVLGVAPACGADRPTPKTSPPAVVAPIPGAPPKLPSDAKAARHVLDRFAFGPSAQDLERIRAQGLEVWFEKQLEPAAISDQEADAALAPYRAALAPALAVLEDFARDDPTEDPMAEELGEPKKRSLSKRIDYKRLAASVMMAELVRHVLSERQVQEVMVDFWTNHFNVFARKGAIKVMSGDYVERAIRPHALGRFENLLLATAQHPAMLVYLDNAQSVAPGSGGKRAKNRGLNENYARELLELHTLGVDGGYTQKDVIEVARILTGWSARRPQNGEEGFVFRERRHDSGEKLVLGTRFEPGGGEAEGKKLLALLAQHPATARHLAQKLCARFVADQPPPGCIESAAAAYRASGGEVRAVLRAILKTPEFWQTTGTKLKSPLEFLASALRVLGARPDGELGLAKTLVMLGQPLMLEPVPTGYPEAAEDWASSGAMLGRMNFALALAMGRAPGVHLDLDRVLPVSDQRSELVTKLNGLVLGGRGSERTLGIILEQVKQAANDDEARRVALALTLASPDFQRQ